MSVDNPKLYETYDREITRRLEERLSEVPIKSQFTDNAVSILKKRYFKKDETGLSQEDVYGLGKRVSVNLAYPDYYYSRGDEEATFKTAETFYKMIMNREFIPNSPTLMNAGREMQQLAACFVLPIEDNMEDILMAVYNMGMIHKSGGGTGFSFDKLRRKNDFVSTTYGKASGPVSFIEMLDATTHSVNQGGFRRGANMGIIRCDNSDILEFIHSKENEKDRRYGNFNFSVALTDEFIDAFKKGEHYVLKNPRKGKTYELTIDDLKQEEESVKQGLITSNERVLVIEGEEVIYQNPVERDIRSRIIKVEKKKVGRVDDKGKITLDARIVFDEIAQLAWKNGEPGIAFIDEMNRKNPTPEIGKIEATNPCGEQPLLPNEACNLGSINLGPMVNDGKIDYNKLGKTVGYAVHLLDNAIDMSNYPLEKSHREKEKLKKVLEGKIPNEVIDSIIEEWGQSEIEKMVLANRKIGLGVMGFADMLYKLEIPYNSEKALETAEEVMRFIQEKGVEKTQEIAEQRGAFPNFDKSIYANEKPRRNATVTTIAPTGTISIISGASSGVEPLFSTYYIHKDADGQKREFVNKNLEEALERAEVDVGKVLSELKKGKSLQELDYIPNEIKNVFVVSSDISVEYHVKMQAAFQRHTDNAVSKTINLPNSATVEDVKKTYLLAHELGCKGITVYREGSREEEVLKKGGKLEKIFHYVKPRKRPDELEGKTIKETTGCGNIFVTRNYTVREDGTKDLFETFAQIGKGGGCAASQNEAIGRLTSMLLRCNANPKEVASQLIGIRCHKQYGFGDKAIYSCADAIGKAIVEFYGEKIVAPIGDSDNFEDLVSKPEVIENNSNKNNSFIEGACPVCGSAMQMKDGCMGGACSNIDCGFSECG